MRRTTPSSLSASLSSTCRGACPFPRTRAGRAPRHSTSLRCVRAKDRRVAVGDGEDVPGAVAAEQGRHAGPELEGGSGRLVSAPRSRTLAQEEILKYVDADQLPKEYGGTADVPIPLYTTEEVRRLHRTQSSTTHRTLRSMRRPSAPSRTSSWSRRTSPPASASSSPSKLRCAAPAEPHADGVRMSGWQGACVGLERRPGLRRELQDRRDSQERQGGPCVPFGAACSNTMTSRLHRSGHDCQERRPRRDQQGLLACH
jgi:hypothetical protein